MLSEFYVGFIFRSSVCDFFVSLLNLLYVLYNSFVYLTITEFLSSLSRNSLGNKGLKKLLDLLPHLNNIQEIK